MPSHVKFDCDNGDEDASNFDQTDDDDNFGEKFCNIRAQPRRMMVPRDYVEPYRRDEPLLSLKVL